MTDFDFQPADKPTFYFIGVTTAKSSIMQVFPQWADYLGLDGCVIQGIDCQWHDEPEEELLHLLPDCVGMLAGVEPLTATVLESARKLKVISRNGVGTNNIDTKTAQKLGIKIRIAPGANARGVAELAFRQTGDCGV